MQECRIQDRMSERFSELTTAHSELTAQSLHLLAIPLYNHAAGKV